MAKKPKKPDKGKSLADLNPELAKQWHPTKNGKLTPYDVLPGSQVKAWWKCPKGDDHEWDAVIADRNKGIGCAVCSNYKVVKSNCLETLNPELAKEWHPTKNGKLTPRDVHPGSSKKVWWKCPKGEDHEWRAVVHSRTNGRGCPICSGRKIVKSTCLATLNPQLAKEWHPTKNGKLTPNDVGIGSSKNVWWKCPKGDDHEWKNTVQSRVSQELGCPVCSNQKIVRSNCLATLDPQLAQLWHPTKNGKLTPYDVGIGSGRLVWWKCPKGDDHEWKETVGKQAKTRKGCPICLGRKLVRSNSFAVLYPELAKQWHPTENGKLTPYDFRPGSNKKVWWQCIKYPEHVWKASINDRTSGTSCPKCNPSTSAPELRIYCELATIFPFTEHRIIVKGYEVDIYLPDLKLGIEYDGRYWHKDKLELDKEKNLALQPEIILLRVREKGLEKISATDISMETDKFSIDIVKEILRSILENKKNESCIFQDKIYKYLKREKWAASQRFEQLQTDRNIVEFEKSISFLFPELVKQWHPTKNLPLLPEHFTPGSHKEIWWQNYLGREWQEEICHRVKKERNRNKVSKNQLNLFG
jgi:very-short-patch-repair endonuclease